MWPGRSWTDDRDPEYWASCVRDAQHNSGGEWDIGGKTPARAQLPTLPFPLGSQIAPIYPAH